MNLPDDYGKSSVQTLAHVGSTSRSSRHLGFWSAWAKAAAAVSPRIVAISGADADPSDPTATHGFESVRHTRIGALLVEPPPGTRLRAGLVALHGYANVPPLAGERERWQELAARGVATLAIRVRGYGGSQLDTGELRTGDFGWIGHGLDTLAMGEDLPISAQVATWVVPLAVADVVNACRAMAAMIGVDAPIFLHGESLGGGLATLAAALGNTFAPIRRIAIGLPSLGDWAWRLSSNRPQPPGIGRDVAAILTRHAPDRERFIDALSLADAFVHAPDVTCAALVKLAERDDVVPAPSAAAVHNALGCPLGTKWRYVVPFGHFEGGLRNLRRHALFDRLVDEFLDPSRDPREAMRLAENVLETGDSLPDGFSPRTTAKKRRSDGEPAQPGLFGDGSDSGDTSDPSAPKPPEHASIRGQVASRKAASADDAAIKLELERILGEAYKAVGRTLDDLPYTAEFDRLIEHAMKQAQEAVGIGDVKALGPAAGLTPLASVLGSALASALGPREVLHRLHTIRKAGRLPRIGRSPATSRPAVTTEEESALAELVVGAVGGLGQRDQLPYTPAFDDIVWRFNSRTGRNLEPYEVWRLVAKLSK
jgi:cephalosporin-C deacetylase-like acetyl esterase